MIEILSSFVKPAMEELGRITVVKIKHLFTYLCCFNNNIQGLTNEAQKLEDARVGLQRKVETAENNAEVILPEVWTWLEDANYKIQVNKKRIVDDVPTVKNDCWTVKTRYGLSRKAVKLTGEMKQLREESSKITDISTPALPAAQAEIPIGTTYDFQTRKQIEEGIMEALEAKEVTTMGICGMGGVGKTTLAKRIMVRVKNEKDIFQEIFMVVVSQPVDNLKIQGAIAESLGLKLGEEILEARATKLHARATKLHARLTGEKRILIVFDDVWEELKLEDLGIPCGNERCTILFTSRNKDVLEKMDVQKVYGVEILCDKESWFLFCKKVGPCVEDQHLFPTAEKVARECKGLPIALITVARALKDKTSITYWEDALQQLQSFDPEDMPNVIKGVYNPLKLSYSNLESKRAKSLFLLCSLFPKDEDISLEELTSYCLGLRMFPNFDFSNTSEGILEKVRRRVFTIVDTLKSRFLLLNGEDEHHVRMHDVVRDVAIYIAKHEANEGIVDVKFNSLHSSSKVTCTWETGSLLRMHGSHWNGNFRRKDFSIFEGINSQLKLLSLESILLKSIPLDVQFLKNLRTLRLEFCRLESLYVVGELLSLEIFYCYACSGIEEFPVEIGNLNQLKLLEFTNCRTLKKIPPGVVSNLVELEEFKMLGSFDGWELAAEVQGQERRNVCLNEFEKLSKLTCLKIEIADFNLAAEEIHFSPKIVRHRVRIGYIYHIHDDDTSHAKHMCAQLPSDINLGSWVIRFLRSSDRLYLKGDGLKSLDLPQAHNKKSLRIVDCCTIKEVVNPSATSNDDLSKFDVFPILESLELDNLPNLEEIYDGPALRHLWKQRPNRNIFPFHQLREIEIGNCKKLRNLFSFLTSVRTDRDFDELLCTQKVFFPMLESIQLRGLEKLEVMCDFSISEESHSFRNIRELTIFENLNDLNLFDLPAMTHLWKSPNLNFPLNNLSIIYISRCPKLRSLFSSTMSMDFLPQLAVLDIKNCEMMEQVLLNDENEDDENQCRAIKFLKLSKLKLKNMRSLTAFGMGIKTIEFPMLEDMTIDDCPELMSFLASNGNNQTLVDSHDDDTFHLFCNQKISFSSLKRVSIGTSDKCNIWCHQIPTDFFSKLQELQISSCRSIRSLFSFSIAVKLVNLKKLEIRWCMEMEKLIEDDDDMVNYQSISVFPVLEDMVIKKCPKLMSLVPSNGNDQNPISEHDDNTSHLFCNKQICGSLKRVSIAYMDKRNIWCRQIPASFFFQLEELEIQDCKAIKSLFSSSIVEELVNIKILKIVYCNEMEKLIEDDDQEMLCEKPRILFPSLKKLVFYHLPKLESFCHWRDDLELPLLEQVDISQCSSLQFFTMKSVITPKLRSIILDWNKKEVRDLNGAIKLHFDANQHQVISTEEGSTSTEASEVETNHGGSEIEEEEIEQAVSDN